MAEEVGIVMKLYDQVSPSLKSIAGNTKAFDKDMDELEASLKAYDRVQTSLTDRMAELRKELSESSIKVKEAEKAYKKFKDETSKGALDAAIDEQEQLRRQMEETKAVIDANTTAYKTMYKEAGIAASKMMNRADAPGLMESLAQAGLFDMIGDASSEAIGTLMTSAYGSDTGSLISSVLGSAASGAAIGSLAGLPGPGTAIGAGVGALAGLISGATSVFENEDAAFIDYYNSLYESVSAATADSITGGSAVAAQREQDAIAFNQLLGDGVGDAYLEDLRALAANTPMEYEDLTAMSRALATGFGDSPERML